MHISIRSAIAGVVVISAILPAYPQCGLAVVPASDSRWYRSDGWALPGVDKATFRPLHRVEDGKQKDWPWSDGITVSAFAPDDSHRFLRIPGAVFDDGGSSKKLLEQTAYLYWIFRWEIHGTTYAYTYDVGSAHTACAFSFDLIDDRGDGNFRLMVSPGHSIMDHIPGKDPEPPPLPVWTSKPSS